jgi:hypothetical protein
MRTLLKFIACLSVCIFLTTSTKADYRTAVGIRVGKFMSDIELKHFYNGNRFVGMEFKTGITKEAFGGYKAKAFYVAQFPLRNSMLQIPVDIVIGAGGHGGYFKERYYKVVDGDPVYYKDNTFCAGPDAKIELEYNTRKFPITVSIDCNVFYSLYNPGPEWIDFGLTLRLKL